MRAGDDRSSWGSDLHLAVLGPGIRAGLERALRTAIHEGRLRPGVRLPSSRALAVDLNIARNTVSAVYEQLTAEGWLAAARGSGTTVSMQVAAAAARPSAEELPVPVAALPYDFRPGHQNVVEFPRAAWILATRNALTNATADAFGYGDVRGRPELRDALAEYLGRVRAVRATASSVMICAGTVHAFSMICAALVDRGESTIAFEGAGWRRLVRVAMAHGLRTVTIGVDADGAQIDELYGTNAAAVLLTPTNQFPSGGSLSAERRRAVVLWARDTGSLIIEDDCDGQFRYDGEPVGALQESAPDCVVYLGTTSRSLAPGLRLAWAVLPADLMAQVVTVKESTVWRTGIIDQLTMAELLRSGTYDRHVRRSRLSSRRRRDRLVAALDSRAPFVAAGGLTAGLHVRLTLPRRLDRPDFDAAITTLATERGLRLDTMSTYRLDGSDPEPSIVVGYATPATRDFEPALDALFSTLTAYARL